MPVIKCNEENDELNKILEENNFLSPNEDRVYPEESAPQVTGKKRLRTGEEDEIASSIKYTQWSTSGKVYIPSARTVPALKPGVYEIKASDSIGIFFEKIETRIEGLLRFPDTNSIKVIEEIEKFWKLENIFEEHNLSYKRGILLWGPAGSGKSATIQILCHDIIKNHNGVVFNFTHPALVKDGVRKFREIQPNTPFIMMMEDIDSIISTYNESTVLNILDGVESFNKCVYIATTNYPERLGARIINRPSRFDKRFKIDFPNAESRKMYLESLMTEKTIKEHNVDIDKWVTDTDKFSVAHLKELFIAVVILGDDYSEAVTTLKSMKDIPTSAHDGRKAGFRGEVVSSMGFSASNGGG